MLNNVRDTLCHIIDTSLSFNGFPSDSVVKKKKSSCNAGAARDSSSIPGLGRSPGEGHGNPLQYSCLENPMDRAAWWARVHRVAKSRTGLKQLSTHALSFKDSEYQRNYPKGLLKRNKFQTLSMVIFSETCFSPAMLLFVVCSKIRFSMLISPGLHNKAINMHFN